LSYLLNEDGQMIGIEGGIFHLRLEAADIGTAITNTSATTKVPTNYLICDRTGFKMKLKHGLREEWNGPMVRGDSWEPRNVQDFVKSKAESLPGPLRPEGSNSFVGQSGVDTAYLEMETGIKAEFEHIEGFIELEASSLIMAADL